MPYYRRRRKPRYRGRRRRTYKRTNRLQRLCNDRSASKWNAGSVASAAFKALKVANSIAGIINVEEKVHDTEITGGTMSTTPSLTRLTAIAQGNDRDERSGYEILMKTLQLNFKLIQNASATNTSAAAMWLVCDKRCDGVIPAYTDIFKDPTAATERVMALRNDNYTERFVVVKKWKVNFDKDGKGSSMWSSMIKLNIHCKYDGTTNAIADAKDNQLYLVAVSDEPTNTVGFTVQARLRFTDN